jgi:hypothetical protein
MRLAPRYFALAVLLDLAIVFFLGGLVVSGLAVDAYLVGAGVVIPAGCRGVALALQQRLLGGA